MFSYRWNDAVSEGNPFIGVVSRCIKNTFVLITFWSFIGSVRKAG